MKRLLAFALALVMLVGNVPVAFAAGGEAKEKATLTFIFSDSYNSALVQEKMKVVFINTTTGEEKIIENAEVNDPGKVPVELEVGGMYRIELRETKYKLTNNSGIFTVSKNDSGKAEARFNTNNFDATKLTVDKWIDTKSLIVKDIQGKKLPEGAELTFVLKEAFNKGVEYKTINGKLPPMRILGDAVYVLKLKDNADYEMEDLAFYGYMDDGNPIEVEEGKIIDNIVVYKKGEKPQEPNPGTEEPSVPSEPQSTDEKTVEVYVWDNENGANTDGLKFDLISPEGTKEYTVEYSSLSLKLKENVDYTLKLKSTEKHSMDDIKCYLKYDNGFRKHFLFGEDNRPIAKVIVNKKSDEKPKRTDSVIKSILVDGEVLEEELDFTLENKGVTKPLMTDNSGTLMLRRLVQGEKYILRLVNNEAYEMDPIEFTFDVQEGFDKDTGTLNTVLPDGSLLGDIELRVKGTGASERHNVDFTVVEGNEKGKVVENDVRLRARTANEASQSIDSKNGIVKFNIKEDKNYLLSMMDNEHYFLSSLFVYYKDAQGQDKEERLLPNEDKEIEFDYKKGTGHRFVVVVKSKKDNPVTEGKCPSDICRFSEDKVQLKEVPLMVSNGYVTKTPTEDVKFVLFNASRQEYEQEIVAKGGVLPALSLYRYDKYILFTKDKNYNIFEEYIQANGEGKLPFNNKTHHFVQNIILAKKTNGKEELNRTNVVLPIYFGSEKVNDINVKFISEYETINATSVDGIVRAKLLEDIQYSVVIDSDKYAMDTLVLTVKDKSEWNAGKYWFDHASCHSVQLLNLVEKGKENQMTTEVVCSKGNTKVMGMNFKDYMLHTDRRDKSTIKGLKDKDADVFIIRLINPHRCEVSKIASGKFTIERKVAEGKIVEKAYLVSKAGDLKEVKFNQKGHLVYVDVDTLSIDDLAFIYKSVEDKPAEEPGKDKPVEKPQPEQPKPTPQNPVQKESGYITVIPVGTKTPVAEEKKPEAKAKNTIAVAKCSLPVNLVDIPGGDKGDAIRRMVSRGVLKGMGDNKFMADKNISRSMVTEVFMRISKDQTAKSKVHFSDVKDDAWYGDSVKWAATNLLIRGYEDGSFKPNEKVSRQAFAVMLDRLLKEYDINMPKVKTVNQADYVHLPEWSQEAVIRMVELGLIEGNDKVDGNSQFSRGELAQTLDKLVAFSDQNK